MKILKAQCPDFNGLISLVVDFCALVRDVNSSYIVEYVALRLFEKKRQHNSEKKAHTKQIFNNNSRLIATVFIGGPLQFFTHHASSLNNNVNVFSQFDCPPNIKYIER